MSTAIAKMKMKNELGKQSVAIDQNGRIRVSIVHTFKIQPDRPTISLLILNAGIIIGPVLN
jgi:hypothetical protein